MAFMHTRSPNGTPRSGGEPEDRTAGIVTRDGPAGARAALAGGPDIWQVVTTMRAVGNDAGRAARYLDVNRSAVTAAIAHHASDPAPVDERIRAERELTERSRAVTRGAGAGAGALLDRAIPAVVAERLRAMGDDVVAIGERPELIDLDAAELLDRTASEGRMLVSRNVCDSLPLVVGGAHPGAILLAADRYPPTPLALDRLVRDLDAFIAGGDVAGLEQPRVEWLAPPLGCPFWPASG